MNKRLFLIVVNLFLLIVFLVSCQKTISPEQSGVSTTHQHVVQLQGEQKEKKKEVWTCPMHPQIKKDGPGQCPICGMDLVRVEDLSAKNEDHLAHSEEMTLPEGHAVIDLSPSKQQMIGVKTGVVEKKIVFKIIQAAGRVAFDPELYTAQNEYVEAIKQFKSVQGSTLAEVKQSALRMVESSKMRLKLLGLSDRQIENLKNSESVGTSLLLPKSGDKFWIYAEVFEKDLGNVQAGLEAQILSPVNGAESFKGKVESVDRVINPISRTAKVRIAVSETKINLRPESFVDVEILSPLGLQVVVPFDAVFDTGKEAWVFLALAGGRFEPRKIQIKQRTGDLVVVAQGLLGGEKIVLSGNFLIDSESRFKGTR